MSEQGADDVGRKFAALLALMATLRSEDGCPWDREQTHHSLKRYLIEEAYELLDAIDGQDDEALVEELGDVLLQVVFHGQIAAETGRFTMADVVQALSDKLIRRHPHVFGDKAADDVDAVLRTWEEIKRGERTGSGGPTAPSTEALPPPSSLPSTPKGLPALMEAEAIQARAARVGFQWDDVHGAWAKVMEELEELHDVVVRLHPPAKRPPASGGVDRAAAADELGDVFFALVNVARYLGIDPEESLRAANRKFRTRFGHIEKEAWAQGRSLTDMTLAEMDALWDEAKKQRRG